MSFAIHSSASVRTRSRGSARVAVAAACAAGLVSPALAQTFTLTPVTTVTQNQPGIFTINGTVSVLPGQTVLHPTVQSSHTVPFNSTFTAGFNGLSSGVGFNAAFLAWATTGTGTYTGAIIDHSVHPSNTGYTASGMPLGMYGGTMPFPANVTLYYTDANGALQNFSQGYQINVVPTPGAAALLGVGALTAMRRRR